MAVNQLKAGAVLNYLVIILSTLVGLLYTPYMLRMMGQNEYGLYSLVASVISYLTILDLGFGNAIVRYTAEYRATGKTVEQYEMFGMFFVLYVIIGLLAFAGGLALYFNVDAMFGNTMTPLELDRARFMMLILIFNLAFTFPMSIFGSIMLAYERFVFPKVITILRLFLNTAIMVALLKMGFKAVAMIILQTIFNIITLVINYIYCKYKLRIRMYFWKFKWGFLKEVALYSFWILLNVIMDRIYWSTGQFVLGAVAGTVAVAVFAVAIQLEHMYMQFSSAISTVFLPKITGMVALKNDNREISDLFIKTGRVQFIVMSFILSGFMVFGRQFIALWAGPGYEDAYLITVLFFIALLIPLIQNLGITILQARNQMKFRSILYIIIATVSLLFQIILAKKMNAIGCAIAIAGALFLGQGLIMNIYYQKKQNLNIVQFWKEILKMAVVPVIVCMAAVFLLRDVEILTWLSWYKWVFLFSVVYLSLFYFLSMNKYERGLFISPVKIVFAKILQ